MDISSHNPNVKCPSVQEVLDGITHLLDHVIASPDIDSLHDSPYPEYTEYIIEATERIRGSKPIVLVTERDPEQWAISRAKYPQTLVCTLDTAVEGTAPINPGQNMYWCLRLPTRHYLQSAH